MKKYFLLACVRFGNNVIAECFGQGMTREQAIATLNVSSPIPLDKDGYAKCMDTTYTVAEAFNPLGA